MDDFVRNIKEQVQTQPIIDDTPISKYRELFSKFILSNTPIKVDEIAKGDITFSIAIKDLGLSYQDIQKFRTELYSYLTVNFMGELLVRENINKFGDILTSIDKKQYADIVNGFEHKKFGFKIVKNRFYFCFHISLVQSILTEDFKREIKINLERS